MRLKSFFATLALFFTLVLPSVAAPVGVAQLKGVYSFQLAGISNVSGYYVGSTWHYVNGNCPVNQHCMTQAFPKLSVGTISFSGTGKATFLTSVNYNPSGSPNNGGPVKGNVWPYTVVGVTGLLGTKANGAVLTLGSYNTSGIATVVLMLTDDTVPTPGVATLQ